MSSLIDELASELDRLQLHKPRFFSVRRTIDSVMRFALDPTAPHAKGRPRYGNWMNLAAGEHMLAESARHAAGPERTQGDCAEVIRHMAGIDGAWQSHRWLTYRELTPPRARTSRKYFVLRVSDEHRRHIAAMRAMDEADEAWLRDDPEDYWATYRAMEEAMRSEREPVPSPRPATSPVGRYLVTSWGY